MAEHLFVKGKKVSDKLVGLPGCEDPKGNAARTASGYDGERLSADYLPVLGAQAIMTTAGAGAVAGAVLPTGVLPGDVIRIASDGAFHIKFGATGAVSATTSDVFFPVAVERMIRVPAGAAYFSIIRHGGSDVNVVLNAITPS